MTTRTVEKLNIGIVGMRRGRSFRAGVEATGIARIHAVCDINPDALAQAAKDFGAVERYDSHEEMLARSELDAVIVSTPMHLHAPQAIQALDRGLHVMSEVTAAVSLEQCRALVAACRRAKGVYMLAENCNYSRPNVLVKALVERGFFGDLYYAEAEYLHELKELNERTPWRRIWQTGVRGITYGTHPLGPVLNWMAGDRVARVCCEGSGSHYKDPRGDPYADDTSVMLARTVRGALVKVRVDMISNRPSVTTAFQLQGTKGVYESARRRDEAHRIWLQEFCKEKETWLRLQDLEAEYLPEPWRNPPEAALKAGHAGSDFYEMLDFIKAVTGEAKCPIGIHEAMDMTLPGLISQHSIARGGAWIEVPDSRTW